MNAQRQFNISDANDDDNTFKMDYSYLVGQRVKGFNNGRITAVSDKGVCDVAFENVHGKTETWKLDLAMIKIATISN